MRLSVSGAVVKARVASHARVKQHMVCLEKMRRCMCVCVCVHDGVFCALLLSGLLLKYKIYRMGIKKNASVCACVCVFCGLAMQLT